MSTYKYIRVSFAYAYYGSPNVAQGTVDIKEGQNYQTKGFEISSDHKYVFVEPFDQMKCRVTFKESWLVKLLHLRHLYYSLFREPIPFLTYRNIQRKTRLVLSTINSVSFDDGWDDSCHSFREISAGEFIPDNRTRRVFADHQILSPAELVRGKVIIYNGWHSGLNKVVPERMVILGGSYDHSSLSGPHFKGLFLRDDGTTWEFHPSLGDCSVTPYEKGYFNNHSYLVDTGETLTEAEIALALSKNKNK